MLGATVGTATIPSICETLSVSFFASQSFKEKSSSNRDRALKTYENCATGLPLGFAVAGGLMGGAVGLVCGVSIQIFKKCRNQPKPLTQPQIKIQIGS